jgi:2-polyprenyl-3-methyl-5-hydroxy-6-metoxy-1,4-benzoquinol methylase
MGTPSRSPNFDDPGRALDAGWAHGRETLSLATQGWQIMAIDFSASALADGRSLGEAAPEQMGALLRGAPL